MCLCRNKTKEASILFMTHRKTLMLCNKCFLTIENTPKMNEQTNKLMNEGRSYTTYWLLIGVTSNDCDSL